LKGRSGLAKNGEEREEVREGLSGSGWCKGDEVSSLDRSRKCEIGQLGTCIDGVTNEKTYGHHDGSSSSSDLTHLRNSHFGQVPDDVCWRGVFGDELSEAGQGRRRGTASEVKSVCRRRERSGLNCITEMSVISTFSPERFRLLPSRSRMSDKGTY
jgi:hypothetical protein